MLTIISIQFSQIKSKKLRKKRENNHHVWILINSDYDLWNTL